MDILWFGKPSAAMHWPGRRRNAPHHRPSRRRPLANRQATLNIDTQQTQAAEPAKHRGRSPHGTWCCRCSLCAAFGQAGFANLGALGEETAECGRCNPCYAAGRPRVGLRVTCRWHSSGTACGQHLSCSTQTAFQNRKKNVGRLNGFFTGGSMCTRPVCEQHRGQRPVSCSADACERLRRDINTQHSAPCAPCTR